ncbi:MAG: UTP--glucose-1-phosphate uridylyltransferase [Phycisphaerales bacterium]
MPTADAPAHTHALAQRLRAIGQGHVLNFESRLRSDQRASLWAQLASLDLDALPSLIERYVQSKPTAAIAGAIHPVPAYPLHPTPAAPAWDRAAYTSRGIDLLRAGKVAAFTVAGGQGSRLGFEGPKGCYAGGSVTGKPLFACLAEWIIAAQHRWCPPAVMIPWYIMTSPANHAATVSFFDEHRFFGLARENVMFFPQGVAPALEIGTGRLLMASPCELSLAPDGHGGSLKALLASGAIADMRRRGIEHISYTQIDNPLVKVIDPLFLGLHAFAPDSSAEMSTKIVAKAHAHEKVGLLCRVGSEGAERTAVIEYSDLPAELATATNPDGSLRYNAGNIAIHIISVPFIERLFAPGSGGAAAAMPWHRADKKIACIDPSTGARIEPAAPNAVKLEMFVFDALPLCRQSVVLETDREEFAPIKNATGPDSVETCRDLQTARAARWLTASGHAVPTRPDGAPDCTLELSPLVALEPADLRGKSLAQPITRGCKVNVQTL